MKRTLLYLLGGVVLGGIIHLVVVLLLPQFAVRDIWSRINALDAREQLLILDRPAPGEANPMERDPVLIQAVCQLSLADAPGLVNGRMPLGFWSVAVFNAEGHVIYSTTNRVTSSRTLDMGIFNPAQTRLLAEQNFEIEEGLLIVESDSDDVFVVVRVAPPHEAMRASYREQLAQLRCLNIR